MIYIKHEENSVSVLTNGINCGLLFKYTVNDRDVVCRGNTCLSIDELTIQNKAFKDGYTDRGLFIMHNPDADDEKMYVSWIVANNGQFDIGVCVNTKWKENGKQKLALNRKVFTETENVVDYIFNSGFLNTAPYK